MGQIKDQLIGFIESEYPDCSWRLFDCVMRAMMHREKCVVDENGISVEGDLINEEIETGLVDNTVFLVDGNRMCDRFENGCGNW